MLTRLAGSIALLLLSAGTLLGQSGEEDLLRFVESAHRSSRELIRTSYCRVKFELTITSASPPSTQSCAGECWHAADASRVRVTDNGQRIDMVWKASIRDSIARKDLNGQELVTATKGSFASRYLHRGDAWVRGLLVVDVPEIGCSVPVEELRAQAAKVERVERLRADGREVVAVRLLFDPTHERQRKWEVEVHFDPSVNYLVRKVIHSRVGARSGFRRFEEVVQFKDCGGGVFFPERIIDRAETSNSSAANTKETVISHIQVNQPVPPSTFQLQYPRGTYVADRVKGTSYRVDPSGRPISAETPLDKHGPPDLLPRQSARGNKETTEEPRSINWVLFGSVGLIATGLALVVRNRRRHAVP